MKKFLLYIVLFIMPIWIILVGVDNTFSSIVRNANSAFSKPLNDMYIASDNHDVLICGNSRASVQYDPNIIDSILGCTSYNLGYDGCAINIQLLKYKHWIKLHTLPQYVIYNIDLWTMNKTQGNNREQIFPYFRFDKSMLYSFDEYHDYTFAEKHIPFCRYIGHRELLNRVLGDSISFYKGYYGYNWDWQTNNQRHNNDLYKCASDANMIQLFSDFISEQQECGISILFVYAPMFHTIMRYSPDIQKMYNMYDAIARQYNIPILDYNYDNICQDSTLFYNKMHLNRTGAEVFTTKLAHDIDSLGLLK